MDTSVGGLLVPEGIILPVFNASTLIWFIRYIYYWNLQFLNNVIFIICFSSLTHRSWAKLIFAILFRPYGFIAPKTLNYLAFKSFNFEHTWWGCFRNASCALIVISTFSWLSLVRFLCCWTVSSRGYHLPSNQCFGNDMVYYYIYYWHLQFLNIVIINKTNVILPQAYIALADFDYLC